ncbi:MAG: anthranilate synthase component II [Candidatus Cyclobacteriaceae bacterium M2_1C_046]
MILLVDNFDSFTYNLVDYFYRSGAECKVVRNNISPDEVDMSGIKGICFSPGPEIPSKAGYLFEYIEKYHQNYPLLGVCLGHQALGEFFGATLIKGIRPMHGKISTIKCFNDPLFNDLPEKLEVVRYNSLVIKDLPKDLLSIAESTEGEVMAIRHSHFPIWGVQFHPEAAMTTNGLSILKNWISCNKIAG